MASLTFLLKILCWSIRLKPSMCGVGNLQHCPSLQVCRPTMDTVFLGNICDAAPLPGGCDTHRFSDSKPEIELTRYGSVFPSPSGLYSKGPANYPLMMGEMVRKVIMVIQSLGALSVEEIYWKLR